MASVQIYTTTYCPFCTRARRLLDEKGVSYEEFNLDEKPEKRSEMLTRTEGRRSVPQVFIDDKGYGGFDDINALDVKGELDPLLGLK